MTGQVATYRYNRSACRPVRGHTARTTPAVSHPTRSRDPSRPPAARALRNNAATAMGARTTVVTNVGVLVMGITVFACFFRLDFTFLCPDCRLVVGWFRWLLVFPVGVFVEDVLLDARKSVCDEIMIILVIKKCGVGNWFPPPLCLCCTKCVQFNERG